MERSAGRLEFERDGRMHRLVAFPHPRGLQIVFRDRTSGVTTYGAGRFLRTTPPSEGVVRLDFNRAHHPPWAHTVHATCPLPPLENRLDLAVEAGGRAPA